MVFGLKRRCVWGRGEEIGSLDGVRGIRGDGVLGSKGC